MSAGSSSAASRASSGRSASEAASIPPSMSPAAWPSRVLRVEGRADPLEQQPALGEHQLHVDAGADLDRAVVEPGAERVDHAWISNVQAPGVSGVTQAS